MANLVETFHSTYLSFTTGDFRMTRGYSEDGGVDAKNHAAGNLGGNVEQNYKDRRSLYIVIRIRAFSNTELLFLLFRLVSPLRLEVIKDKRSYIFRYLLI